MVIPPKTAVALMAQSPLMTAFLRSHSSPPENGRKPGTVEKLIVKPEICSRKNSSTVLKPAVLPDRLKYLGALCRKNASENQPQADYYDDGGEDEFPQNHKAEHLSAGKQKKNAYANADDAAGFVAVGYKTDKAGNDDKQRPPSFKKQVEGDNAKAA